MVAYENYTDVAVGWPSLIPPILAMVLALSTKEVVSSLFVGVFSAAVIYSIAVAKGMVENLASANVLDVIFTVMGIKISNNVHICLFILFIGALIHLVSVSGGSKAYGVWAKKAIKGRRRSMFSTMALGAMMFLDDYFNSITTSTVMKTVTEVNNVSRPKTAYIVHTMSTNMCITIPLTSWAAAIVSQIEDSGVENSFVVFLSAIPFNIYSLLCFLLVLILITFDFDYGKMKFYEDNAKLGLTETNEDVPEATEEMTMKVSDKGTMWDLLLPIFVMVVLAVFFMFYLGGMWSGEKKSITQVLGDTSAPKALLYACFVALITTLVMYVPRKLMTFAEWINYFIEGMKTMISTLIILVLAWCVSGTSGDLLQTGTYIGTLVKNSPIPPQPSSSSSAWDSPSPPAPPGEPSPSSSPSPSASARERTPSIWCLPSPPASAELCSETTPRPSPIPPFSSPPPSSAPSSCTSPPSCPTPPPSPSSVSSDSSSLDTPAEISLSRGSCRWC